MNINLFGPLQCHDGERTLRASDLGGAKPRGLLELLLLARGRTMSKEQLAEALWGDRPPQNVAGTLEHYVCVLRRKLFADQALARQVLVTEPGAYRFDTSRVQLDLDEFDRLMRQAEHADEARRRMLLSQAVDMASDDLLDDAPYAPWAATERELYRSRVTRAHLAIARDCLAAGQYDCAMRHGESALRFAPYSEEAFRTLMVADHALGHADLARAAHRRCRQVLADQLGVDPTSETEAVAAAIDAGMPADELVRAFLDRSLHVLLVAA
jgi:DNA-binding SARP family transcriptional activator